MADIFEFTLSLDLRDELSEADVAELRWHLGLGDLPESGLRIESGSRWLIENDEGHLVELDPQPLLDQRGPACETGGILTASLERTPTGWRLEARQEVHPEVFPEMSALMRWLYLRVDFGMVQPDGSVELGRLRGYEDEHSQPLLVRDDRVFWPR
ncbi:hypothetical protein [Nocardia bhagyanarayanae]|uniref:Uncharacterized protein n=1 Tax=Nocardia bhagyanarayanae TaxID=1215925 RepID=A0A543EXP6_9NOCA|nr:hypothetical protein [Nocardia bhagyanarayanae]TQM26356.1 hypothetical protein FB390_6545 [Nocardia bhagyanarayanae]